MHGERTRHAWKADMRTNAHTHGRGGQCRCGRLHGAQPTHLEVAHEEAVASTVEVAVDALVVDVGQDGARLGALVAVHVDRVDQRLHELVAVLREFVVLHVAARCTVSTTSPLTRQRRRTPVTRCIPTAPMRAPGCSDVHDTDHGS